MEKGPGGRCRALDLCLAGSGAGGVSIHSNRRAGWASYWLFQGRGRSSETGLAFATGFSQQALTVGPRAAAVSVEGGRRLLRSGRAVKLESQVLREAWACGTLHLGMFD